MRDNLVSDANVSTAMADEDVVNWRVPLRGGDDAALVVGGKAIVSEMDQNVEGKPAHRVSCWGMSSGEAIWSQVFPEKTYKSQDISQRYPVRPIATSCVEGNRIVCISYGGLVRCLNIKDGQLIWEHDLVEEFEASPIQFGAASSPWSDGERVVVACGGAKALLIAFDWEKGAVSWMSEPGEASYTSLVELPIAGSDSSSSARHLVYAARDYIVGIDPKSGKELWRKEYPQAGLTNAVTPLVIGPSELIVAGQGFGGTVRLEITPNAIEQTDTPNSTSTYTVNERWSTKRFKPFYCNWVYLRSSQLIVGFADNTLQCIDAESGERLWAKRGWTDSNVVIRNNQLIIARGDGGVAIANVTRNGIEVERAEMVAQDRVWVAPTIVGSRALIRGRESLTCVDIDHLPAANELPAGNQITSMEAMYGGGSKK